MKTVKTVIPFKPDNPKSRLSSIFTEKERRDFVELSLENVLTVLKESEITQIEILSKSELSDKDKKRLNSIAGSECALEITTDERDLNTAINAYLKKSEMPILIVMADLALLTKENIAAMIAPKSSDSEQKLIRLAPGKDGGTNMIYIEAPNVFEVNYYGESFKKHKEEAERKNLSCETHESFYAAIDMDEPEDLKEILNHGSGKLKEFVCMALEGKKTQEIQNIE